jgi:uncharacterized protein
MAPRGCRRLMRKEPPGARLRYNGRPATPSACPHIVPAWSCYHGRVSGAKLSVLIAVFFFTSVISVVTGSTSLITVPVMIALGIEAHIAIATNMLALTFMSVGGSLPFIGRGVLTRSRLLPSIVLTIIGSGLGASLLLRVPLKALQITIAVAMIGVAVFSLLNKNLGRASHDAPASNVGVITGYATTFLLAIYGGFFSGGYVTMLTAAFVLLFGMTFLQAVATTKVINVFSSGVATLVFVSRGVIDLKLGGILGVSMFLGALLGSRIALLLSIVWLRRIFIAAVLGLAVKLLLPLH